MEVDADVAADDKSIQGMPPKGLALHLVATISLSAL